MKEKYGIKLADFIREMINTIISEKPSKIGLFGFFYFSSKTMKLKNAENLISKSSVS